MGRREIPKTLDYLSTQNSSRTHEKTRQHLRKYSTEILPFIHTHLTNAVAEGLNRIIKIVKNRASGFRTLDAFTGMIYLTVGDVDIPAQIPTKFRAL